MSKTSLLVPEHVAASLAAEDTAKESKKDGPSLENAYVEESNRVLDPSLLDKSLKERLPTPTGWRILVMPYQGQSITEGGIYIPDEIRQREQLATVVAYVLKVGPLAYKDPAKFGDWVEPWCKEGEWVCIGRYAGSRFKIDGGEIRIINDDEVIATILEPGDVMNV
jgi:co-chaperonin GroES (HSP10)|tara:strand:- start:3329 stop:3826 length:498 start_codon:yes stop_codon:yes gene_type:complete